MQTENPDSKVIRPQPGKLLQSTSYIKSSNYSKKVPQFVHGYEILSLWLFSFFFSNPQPPPTPILGMCVKTVSEPGKQKVFVNICQSNSVPLPPELSREELVELLQSEDPSGFRVPMSLGEPHAEVDNSM